LLRLLHLEEKEYLLVQILHLILKENENYYDSSNRSPTDIYCR
jgi:hypothetical protein